MKHVVLTVALLLLGAPVAFSANLAIIDSGVDYKHKDLSAKMWTNANGKTVDADGTVYNEDTHGWNFAEKNNQIIDYKYLGTFSNDCYKIFEVQGKVLTGVATEEEKTWYAAKKKDETFLKELSKFGNFVHGSHVSGISSKDTNGAKLIGVKLIATEPPAAPGGRLMQLAQQWAKQHHATFGDEANNPIALMLLGFLAKQQAGMLTTVGKYAHAVHADVANGSFGTSVAAVSPVVSQLLEKFLGHKPTEAETKEYAAYFVTQIADASKEFVAAAPETLFVFAAGNDGTNNDTVPVSPANIKADNSIAVAATQGSEKLASFSCYGEKMVEVAAPGVIIKSTIPGDQYLALSGTSMAAPFVTNVAGAIKDANPAFKAADIKRVLMETVDVKDFLKGKVKTSGIVNKKRAVRAAELSTTIGLNEAIAQSRIQVSDEVSTTDSVSDFEPIVLPLPNFF